MTKAQLEARINELVRQVNLLVEENTELKGTGKVASLEEALKAPLDYELTHSVVGWTINEIDSRVQVLLSEEQAHSLLVKQEEARNA